MKDLNKKTDVLLAKIGLMSTIIHKDPAPYIFNSSIFEVYTPKEYLNSQIREMDEVYRISEKVVIHRLSGMRVHYLETENYGGDELIYKLLNIFLVTVQNKNLSVIDADFSKQHFITEDGIIPFSTVEKNAQ